MTSKERKESIRATIELLSKPECSIYYNEIKKLHDSGVKGLIGGGKEKHDYFIGYIAAIEKVSGILLKLKGEINERANTPSD